MSEKPKDLFDLAGISYLVFNKDMTQCALSKKDHLIYIYKVIDVNNHSTWELIYTLDMHVQYISGLDWSSQDQIVSCSYDKTIYVWIYEDGKWNPRNVNKITKVGYLTISWSKRGDKFTTGTSDKELLIGYFDTDSNMWNARNIKGHKSSVVAAQIDPSSLFVISGSTDMTINVFSCYFEIDNGYITDDMKGLCKDFGEKIYCFEPDSWATSVAWSLNGKLCFAANQNATIAVIDHLNKKHTVITLDHSPISFIVPINDTSFYAVGFDRQIYLYEQTNDTWKMQKKMAISSGSSSESNKNKMSQRSIPEFSTQGGGVRSRLKMFEDNKSTKTEVTVKSENNENLHPAIISSITVTPNKIITSDLAGFIKYWELK